jgi:N-acetylmuramoyl-L-alanine amidase
MPATLVELGFLTNYAEERRLRSAAYRQKLARAIAQGIKAYQSR